MALRMGGTHWALYPTAIFSAFQENCEVTGHRSLKLGGLHDLCMQSHVTARKIAPGLDESIISSADACHLSLFNAQS